MKANPDKNCRLQRSLAKVAVGLLLASALSPLHAYAQSAPAEATQLDAKPAGHKGSDSMPRVETYKTFYLTNITQQADLNDIQTALRNLLPYARLYAVPTQEAIVMRATAEDLQTAQQVIADLDRTKKLYRLTYTLTETDEGKRIGIQHYSIIIASGSKTDLKQGSKVPILALSGAATSSTEVTYLDVGLEIEASLDGYLDGVRLRSRLVQSSLAEEKPGAAMSSSDPVIRQTALEGTSTLIQGKPLILGSLDLPGSTRHQEVEVVAEVVR